MNTEAIFKLVHATVITLGYGVILIIYMMWGPPEANRALDVLIGGLSTGYVTVMNSIYGGSKVV